MLRRSTVVVLIGAAAVSAASALPLGAAASGKSPVTARVTACQSGDTAELRSGVFYGRMRSLDGTQRMMMRFTLLQQFGDGKPVTVDAPALRAWRPSKPGVKVFGYSQTVTALEAGGGYRAKIDYRWLDAAGNLQRKATRETPVCMQTGDLPNLEALAVTMLSGPATNTAVYQLTVRNVGLAPATDVAVELYVDGAATDVGHIAALAAGEERKVRITGPVCKRALRAVVDPSDTIHEMSEGDNTSKFPCP